ncbi:MAG: nicotinate (nicotinamide) nucleotide adenylyltransferase [Nitrospirae bacterium]|nr:nicotinate (nicotinamide) nucleotide adenylyltransferase [Nitrospirota bacterium]
MKIGIFGGAFNPVHYGHLKTADEVLRVLSLDKIIFVPAGSPPFNKPGLAEAGQRFEMVKAAIAGHPEFEVSDIELRREGKSYTIETVEKLAEKGAALFLIIGIDAFRDMPLWKETDRLFSMVNVVVISRPGYSFAGLSSSPYLKRVSIEVLDELDSGKRRLFALPTSGEKEIILCKVVDVNVSSSHIREAISRGMDTASLLPESVKSYIILHNLYKNNNN